MALHLRGTQWSLWQHQSQSPRIFASPNACCMCLSSSRRLPFLCCSAKGESISSTESTVQKNTPFHSWTHWDPSFVDRYAGWSAVESDTTDDFAGSVVKICTGIVIAVGFALASYSIYSTKGNIQTKDSLSFVPVVSQRQQGPSSSFMDSASPEGTSSPAPELNGDGHVLAEAPISTTEVVTDMQRPSISGQAVSYFEEDADVNNKKFILSAAAATQLPMQSLESKQFSSSNAAEDPSLAGSSKNGKERQSKRGSITITDADIEQEGSVVESSDAITSSTVRPNQVIDMVASNEFASDMPINHPSSIMVPAKSHHDFAEKPKSEIPPFLETEGIREDTGSSKDIDAASLDLDFTSRDVENLLEEVEQDLPFYSATSKLLRIPFEMSNLMIGRIPLGLDSLNESIVTVNASQNLDKVVGSTMFEVSQPTLGSEVSKSLFGVPAPSAHSAVSKVKPGRVLVPAVTDQLQEQALAALQRLKVIEADTEAGNVCVRRQYTRWLITASHLLSRSSAHKVFPAMFIEDVSELAFDDVLPDDPDFPFIQGLAEAGLISSRLSAINDTKVGKRVLFLPDSPLSRQDLVSWKIALECHNIPKIDHESLKAVSGFIDSDKIHKDAIHALSVDALAGEHSIVAMAFGYTRRFQPDKPVTVAQAAVALTSGEAREHVAEELARLEAETVAEVAVATEIAMEARAKTEANAAYFEELEEERKRTAVAQNLVEALRSELNALKSEREEEKFFLLKDRAAIESEKELLQQIKIESEQLAQELFGEKAKVAFEKHSLEKLVKEAEDEKLSVTTLRSELDVEKKALTLARVWAEDEAKRARALAKILEEARKRWENKGIEVHVDQELDENNIPSTIWTYDHETTVSPSSSQKPYHLILLEKAECIKNKCKEMIDNLSEITEKRFIQSRQKTLETLLEVWKKAVELQQAIYSFATEKTSELASKTSELHIAATSAVADFSTRIAGGSKKLVEGIRGGVVKAG